MSTKPTNFRITLWFKLGSLAEQAEADADAAEPAPGDTLLPIEDRYLDDGSVTSADSRAFSLRSGRTQTLPLDVIDLEELDDDGAELAHLVQEMKHGRRPMLAALAGGVAALCGVVLLFVM